MINLISTAAGSSAIGGSVKVFRNLVKGLDLIRYPYVVNRELGATHRLWIHDDIFALPAASRAHKHAVVGPNLWILPRDISRSVRFDQMRYLQPSDWVADVWARCGFGACPIRVWPVGVDTEEFRPPEGRGHASEILLYIKRRGSADVQRVRDTVGAVGLPVIEVVYGTYEESAYKKALARTRFAVWCGRHESQGLALLEALASDVPVLVCDVTSVRQAYGDDYEFDACATAVRATSAPYFDERCGLKITDLDLLADALKQMTHELDRFRPRDYILENLSLEKQARAFVDLWSHWGLTAGSGVNERALSDRPWAPPPMDVLRLRSERRLRELRRALAPRH